MIVSIGEAFLKNTGSGLQFGGKALARALKCAGEGKPVLFAGAVSSDAGGRQILEFLIDNFIFFDPVFCNTGKPTPVLPPGSGDDICAQTADSCIFSITEERLESVFTLNSDVKEVFIGGLCLRNPNVRKAILDVVGKRPHLEIFLDRETAASGFESLHNARFEDSIATWL